MNHRLLLSIVALAFLAAPTAPSFAGAGPDCTILEDGQFISIAPKLLLSKIGDDPELGNEILAFTGEFVLPSETSFADIDPFTKPVRIALKSGDGGTRSDSTFAMSEFVGKGSVGWKINGNGRKWTYIDKTNGAESGIRKVLLLDREGKKGLPNQVRVIVVAKNGTLPFAIADVAPKIVVIVGDAANGECGETEFAIGNCRVNGKRNRLLCL